jgi:hypothetical protein
MEWKYRRISPAPFRTPIFDCIEPVVRPDLDRVVRRRQQDQFSVLLILTRIGSVGDSMEHP